jgi:O-antigen/teichoic acid export membrane protein
MTKINNIAKNTSYLTLALIGQKIISFTYFTILANNLAPEQLGKYYLAISLTTIFAIFIDLGLINVLTREVAKRPFESNKLLGNVLSLKIPLSVIAIGAVILTTYLLGYETLTKHLVYISSISMILDSFTTTFFAVSRGHHNLIYESVASILFQLIVMSFGLWALYSGYGLLYIMLALAIASLFNFIYSSIVLSFKIGVKISLQYDKKFFWTLIKLALPFAGYAIFQRLYTYLDSVLLSILANEMYVGIYQIPFKIIFALQFLPLAFVASLYPALSHYWVHNKEQLLVSFKRALNYLMIISVPIIFGTIVLADKIIMLFNSAYSEAILPLQIIIIALLFIFLNYPIGSLLNACDRQKKNTFNMGLTVVLSVALNLILIPLFQAVGAAITVLVSNMFMFFLGLYYSSQIMDLKLKSNILVLLKTLAAATIMASLVYILKGYLHIIFLVLIAIVVYFLFIFIFRAIKKEDLLSVYRALIKKEKL